MVLLTPTYYITNIRKFESKIEENSIVNFGNPKVKLKKFNSKIEENQW